MTVLAGLVQSANASILSTATLTASSGVTYSAVGAISSTGNLTAKGNIQGDNWTVVPITSNIWLRIG
mgnify:FL=1